jgi:hypothetical protein
MGERDKEKEDEIAKLFESIRGEPAFAGNWRDSRSFKSTMGPTKRELEKLTHDLLEQVSQSRGEVSKTLAGVHGF